ncbi:hypothetical protein BC828DRAFT_399081 [Blastocladiella britannica]|nr:hypothetical protein BC828DRAFT_399081 [Blastocladiella britannica]
MAKIFAESGKDFTVEEENSIEWTIDSWNDLKRHQKIFSPAFTCAGKEWRIMLFPVGNGANRTVSFYVQLDWPNRDPDEAICADFVLAIAHPEDDTVHHMQYSNHRFGEVELDWGFSQFLPLTDLGKFSVRTPVSDDDAAAATAAAPAAAGEAGGIAVTTAAATAPASPNDTIPPGAGVVGPAAIAAKSATRVRLVAKVRALRDETGIMFHSFTRYNSKRVTGHVGLKNQGATCYMNSILQSLYCTNYFRRAVYQIPLPGAAVAAIEGASESSSSSSPAAPTRSVGGAPPTASEQRSVTRALQRLFYFMQTADDAVETNELTRSFGWNTVDAFAQHDVQEFLRVLCDNLEEKMKGTPAHGMIPWLLVGKMKSYIKCVNVDYESARTEDFYDIQLNVKGMKNIYESFRDYIQVELLEGDNKYQAEGYGLQDAKKGVVFTQFPPVLHLQLKRFEYDFMRDAMVKINDRYEFPTEMDLGEFLVRDEIEESDGQSKEAPVSQRYHLHGVLVHSGSVDGGHYCAFIRPSRGDKWYKFDDDRVIPVTIKEVTEDNFGGEYPAARGPGGLRSGAATPRMQYKRFTNAYMLVYIREADYDKVLGPVTEEDVPLEIRTQLEEERSAKEQREREVREREFMFTVRIVGDQAVHKHTEFDLWPFMPLVAGATTNVEGEWHERFDKTQTAWQVVHERYTAHLNCPPDSVRFWLFSPRENGSVRPDTLITPDLFATTLKELKTSLVSTGGNLSPYELHVFAEFANPTAVMPLGAPFGTAGGPAFPPLPNSPDAARAGLKSGTALIFVKVFDVASQSLRVVGHMHVDVNAHIKDSLPTMRLLAGFPETARLLVFEEVHPKYEHQKCKVNAKDSWKSAEFENGDIVVVQTEPEHGAAGTYPPGTLLTVPDYFDFLLNKVDVVFKAKSGPAAPGTAPAAAATTAASTALAAHHGNGSNGSPISLSAPAASGEFTLTVSKKMPFDDLAARVALELGIDDPTKLRFTSTYLNEVPRAVVKRGPGVTLLDMLGGSSSIYHVSAYGRSPAYGGGGGGITGPGADRRHVVLYEILAVSLAELEAKRLVRVACVLPGKDDTTVEVMLPRTATVAALRAAVLEKLQASGALTAEQVAAAPPMIISEMSGARLTRELADTSALSMLPEYTLFALQVSVAKPTTEPLASATPVHMVQVVHMNRTPSALHGVPFMLPVYAGEDLAATKQRIQQYLGWTDKDMSKVVVRVISHGMMYDTNAIIVDDGSVLSDVLQVPQSTPSSLGTETSQAAATEATEGEGPAAVAAAAAPPPVYSRMLVVALDHPQRRLSKLQAGFERAVKIFN